MVEGREKSYLNFMFVDVVKDPILQYLHLVSGQGVRLGDYRDDVDFAMQPFQYLQIDLPESAWEKRKKEINVIQRRRRIR